MGYFSTGSSPVWLYQAMAFLCSGLHETVTGWTRWQSALESDLPEEDLQTKNKLFIQVQSKMQIVHNLKYFPQAMSHISK